MNVSLPQIKTGKRPSLWGRALRLALAAALVIWLVRSGRLEFSMLLGLRPGWALLGVVVGLALGLLLTMWRWLVLVRAQGFALPAGAAWQIGLIGVFANTFLPAGLGIEGAKLYYVAPVAKGNMGRLLSSMVIDRLLGMMVLLGLAALFAGRLLTHLADGLGWRILGWSGAALLAVVGGLFVASKLGRLPGGQQLAVLSRAIAAYRHQPRVLAVALLLSVAGHLSVLGGALCAFHALGVEAGPGPVLAVAPLVNLAASIPTTPMALGVSDSVAAVLYPQVGLAGGAEAVMLARGVTLLISLACAVGLLMNQLPLAPTEDKA